MVTIEHLKKSSKRIGKYEEPIMKILSRDFQSRGYTVLPHTRLNVAWSNIFSDIDVLTMKDNLVSIVEIKSHRDNLQSAFRQIDRLKDMADYVYVATDRRLTKWNHKDIGLLYVDLNTSCVTELYKPTMIRRKPVSDSLEVLYRECLVRTLFMATGQECSSNKCKRDVAKLIQLNVTQPKLRSQILEIVTCKCDCKSNCPIWGFR